MLLKHIWSLELFRRDRTQIISEYIDNFKCLLIKKHKHHPIKKRMESAFSGNLYLAISETAISGPDVS